MVLKSLQVLSIHTHFQSQSKDLCLTMYSITVRRIHSFFCIELKMMRKRSLNFKKNTARSHFKKTSILNEFPLFFLFRSVSLFIFLIFWPLFFSFTLCHVCQEGNNITKSNNEIILLNYKHNPLELAYTSRQRT